MPPGRPRSRQGFTDVMGSNTGVDMAERMTPATRALITAMARAICRLAYWCDYMDTAEEVESALVDWQEEQQ